MSKASYNRDRRLFLRGVALTSVAALTGRAIASPAMSTSADKKLSIGIMGLNGRGTALAKSFLELPSVQITHLCDVDSRAIDKAASVVIKVQQTEFQRTGNFRTMLTDPDLDAVVIATPNHWHAPATIEACAAGKHVYVEKPCSHTGAEGEWAVEAARKHQRVVQMGTQRRSWPAIRQAIETIHSGGIGEILYARNWYNNRRGPIGVGKTSIVPDWLDWELWQGPAPRQSYRDNVLHYNWHWFWDWGNGELGNNGVHGLDVARWGMGVTYPIRVSAGGGRYRYDDDQQTPDTMMVTYDFPGGKTITWEGLSWSSLGPHDSQFGISFHGTEGSIVIHDPGYTVFDMRENELSTHTGEAGDSAHLTDFVDAIKNNRRPNADIEVAHQSTLLCHLGNIAYRTNSTLVTDESNGHILSPPDAEALWSRKYEPGWEPHQEPTPIQARSAGE